MRVLPTINAGTGELLASTNVSLPGKATWGTTALSFVAKTPNSTLTFRDNSSTAFQTAIFLDDIRVTELPPSSHARPWWVARLLINFGRKRSPRTA